MPTRWDEPELPGMLGRELVPVNSVRAIESSGALDLLRRAVLQLHEMAEQYRGDPYATGTAVINITTLLADIRSLLGDLKVWTHEAMPTKRLEIPGVGVIEQSGEGNRDTWDDRRTLQAIILWAYETGQMDRPIDVADIILRFAHIDYFRKTQLKEAGINYKPERDDKGNDVDGSALVTTERGVKSIRVMG